MLDNPPVGRRKFSSWIFGGKGGSCLDSWAGSVVLLYLSDPPNFHMLFTAESSLTILVHSLAQPCTALNIQFACSRMFYFSGYIKSLSGKIKNSRVLRLKSSQVSLNQFS